MASVVPEEWSLHPPTGTQADLNAAAAANNGNKVFLIIFLQPFRRYPNVYRIRREMSTSNPRRLRPRPANPGFPDGAPGKKLDEP